MGASSPAMRPYTQTLRDIVTASMGRGGLLAIASGANNAFLSIAAPPSSADVTFEEQQQQQVVQAAQARVRERQIQKAEEDPRNSEVVECARRNPNAVLVWYGRPENRQVAAVVPASDHLLLKCTDAKGKNFDICVERQTLIDCHHHDGKGGADDSSRPLLLGSSHESSRPLLLGSSRESSRLVVASAPPTSSGLWSDRPRKNRVLEDDADYDVAESAAGGSSSSSSSRMRSPPPKRATAAFGGGSRGQGGGGDYHSFFSERPRENRRVFDENDWLDDGIMDYYDDDYEAAEGGAAGSSSSMRSQKQKHVVAQGRSAAGSPPFGEEDVARWLSPKERDEFAAKTFNRLLEDEYAGGDDDSIQAAVDEAVREEAKRVMRGAARAPGSPPFADEDVARWLSPGERDVLAAKTYSELLDANYGGGDEESIQAAVDEAIRKEAKRVSRAAREDKGKGRR
jgi:hypothetical protein